LLQRRVGWWVLNNNNPERQFALNFSCYSNVFLGGVVVLGYGEVDRYALILGIEDYQKQPVQNLLFTKR
jgi:hypothetical protein